MQKIKKNKIVLMSLICLLVTVIFTIFRYELNFSLPKFVSNQSPYLHCTFRPFENLVNSQEGENNSPCPFAKDAPFQYDHDQFVPFTTELIKKYYPDYVLEFANLLGEEFSSDPPDLFKPNGFDRVLAANQKKIVVWPCRPESPMHAMNQNTWMFVVCGAKITPAASEKERPQRTAFIWAGISQDNQPAVHAKRLFILEQPAKKGLFLADILIYNTRLALQVDKVHDFDTRIWKKEATLYAYQQEKFYPLLTYPRLIDETQLDVCASSMDGVCSLRTFELSLEFKVSKQSMDAYLVETRSVRGKNTAIKYYYPVAFNDNQWSYRYTYIQPDLSIPVNRYE